MAGTFLNLANYEPAKMAMGADNTFFNDWRLGGKSLVAFIGLQALAGNYGNVGRYLLAFLNGVQVSRSNDHNLLKHNVRDLGVQGHLRDHRPFVEVLIIKPFLTQISQKRNQLPHGQVDHGLRPDAK